jgi:hypothetical protein
MGPHMLQFGLLFICVSPAIVIGASLPFVCSTGVWAWRMASPAASRRSTRQD